MEPVPVKKGYLYKAQKAIGLKKCWSKRWALLYPGSETQPPYLETFDSKDAASREGSKSSTQTLPSSVQATPVTKRNRSREHAFEVNLDDKVIAYAVDSKEELDEWLEVIRNVADVRLANRVSSVPDLPLVTGDSPQPIEGLMENTLYDSYENMVFKVSIKPGAFSDSLNLQGSYLLQVDSVKLTLLEEETNQQLYAWPYRYLRRYGRDKTSFSMEAGRKCDSGPGMIIFMTRDGNDIFHNIQNFVNNISGRHGIPSTQGQPGIDGHQQQQQQRYVSVLANAGPGKAPPTPPITGARSAASAAPIGALAESSVFRKKLAKRKDAVEPPEDPSADYRRQPKTYQPKPKKEVAPASKPQLPSPPDHPDPLYSEVMDKAAADPPQVSTDGQYYLAGEGERERPPPLLPAALPEDSEYDQLDTNRVVYNMPEEEPRSERWRDHGRTEDNIHTENYFSDAIRIMQDEGGNSSPEPEQGRPLRPSHKPVVPLPKARQAAGSRTGTAPDSRREPAAPVEADDQMYDSVLGLPGMPPNSGPGPGTANGEDVYDHFVRPSLSHPVPAPRKIGGSLTQQQQQQQLAAATGDSDSELYDHLQREASGGGGSRHLPKSFLPGQQRSFDQEDTYNTLVHEPQQAGHGGGSSALAAAAAGVCTLPDESQYTEAILRRDPSSSSAVSEGADETGLDENPYDVVAYQ